jgi:hypothetical protein
MARTRTLGDFGADAEQSGQPTTPADLPSLDKFPSVKTNHERLLGISTDRTVLYHRPSHELWEYDADAFAETGEFEIVEQSNTAMGTPEFREFTDQIQEIDWLATSQYSDIFFGEADTDRYPEELPAPIDQGEDDRAGERLLGVDSRGIGHYEVYEVDIPYIRRYVPFRDNEIISWDPNYHGYVTPERGLAQRRIAQYIITTEIECHGWTRLSEYGQTLTVALLDEFSPVYELVEDHTTSPQ